MTTAIICGGRSYGLVPDHILASLRSRYEEQARRERDRIEQILDAAVVRLDLRYLAMGDATGADAFAAAWAERRAMPFKVYEADWSLPNNSGGPIRNKAMLDEAKPDYVIAFPGSKGTRNMCSIAEKAGVKVYKVDWA
jgi:glutathione S-transferase